MQNNIIDFIRHACTTKDTADITDEDVCTLVSYAEYFVKPGRNLKKYVKEMEKAIYMGMASGIKNQIYNYDFDQVNESILFYIKEYSLKVLRKYFDSKYFESQIPYIYDSNIITNNLFD